MYKKKREMLNGSEAIREGLIEAGKRNKNVIPLLIPMLLIMIITISALIIKFQTSPNNMILAINGTLILLIFWMIIEGLIHVKNNLSSR